MLYHIKHGRPIGPSWKAYTIRPELTIDRDDLYGTWVEEVSEEELRHQFRSHVLYARQHFPKSYFPYALYIDGIVILSEDW